MKLSKEEIEMITKSVMKLTTKEIDNLWSKCKWVDSSKEQGNKALPNWRIKKIKEDYTFAKESIENLLLETPKKEVEKILEEIKSRH